MASAMIDPDTCKQVPMYYRMPVDGLRDDLRELFPKGTNTLALVKAGFRNATTMRRFASVGDCITFAGDPASREYEVTQVVTPDLASPEGRKKWEQAEGWSLEYIDANPKLRAQVYSSASVQTFFCPIDVQPKAIKGLIYAGIGSRSTPEPVLGFFKIWAGWLEDRGARLRSGGAYGADTAFEEGVKNPANKAIYLPGSSFNGRQAGKNGCHDATRMPGWQHALRTVDQYHPASNKLGSFARRLMARNALQVLGPNMDSPAGFVFCWTPSGDEVGGTSQAIRIAKAHGIPVCNIGNPTQANALLEWIREIKAANK